MTATATALETVRAIAIDGPQLRTLCQQRTDIGYHVMARMAEALSHRLTATRLQLLDLYAHTTPHVLSFGSRDH
jgi:CRP-like cAMP-binding protein